VKKKLLNFLSRDLCININNHQNAIFHQLDNFMKHSHSFAMAVFHKITKSAKLVILLITPTYAKVSSKLYVGLFITLIIVVLCYFDYINTEEKITLTSIGSGLIAITGLYFFHKRLKNQDKQIQNQDKQISLQINQRVDERFNSAITLLGSSETSARTGAVYALHELALEEEKYRQQIVQILCSHIRSKTNEQEYKKNHEERPSNEIQTTLNLLFKEKERGLYAQDFAKVTEFPRADLSHAYLVGASFENARCQGANFRDARCQGANFRDARCQGANFGYARCQGANFGFAQCQEADFGGAQCQGANFGHAQCQEAKFGHAQCQGADFGFAQCQEAFFLLTQCQGADFGHAQCQGANFGFAQCQGADFGRAQCQEANFGHAQCQGANFGFAQCQGADFGHAQCRGAYALQEFSTQTLSSRIGKKTKFEVLQLEGEITEKYLSESLYEDLQTIIKDNKGKEPKYGTPEGCITGILENSEQLQAIIKKDWKKLEQLNKKQHD
jgi:uncharacterized protein YjbI with pentapeptide repeats